MPKIVDHDKQREIIAKVVWEIISIDGIEAASVRRISKETGLSMGAMRHYFPSQTDLYQYLMELVSQHAGERIQKLITSTNAPSRQQLIDLTMQLLPVHSQLKLETEVWLWFNAKAVNTAALHSFRTKLYEDTYELIKLVINALVYMKYAKPGLDKQYETDRLYALVDGIAMHSLMHPKGMTDEIMMATITRHIEGLCK